MQWCTNFLSRQSLEVTIDQVNVTAEPCTGAIYPIIINDKMQQTDSLAYKMHAVMHVALIQQHCLIDGQKSMPPI